KRRGRTRESPHLWFPGCFTRPPGTSTRHHPREPTASKPVVPEDACPFSLAVPPRGKELRGCAPGEKATRPRAALRTLHQTRGPGFVGGAASHLDGLALCGSVPRRA